MALTQERGADAAEVESSRTCLASRMSSRTHFEVLGLEGQVLGLGLEASSPRKLACPRLEDSTIFLIVKILWSAWKIFWKTFFLWRSLENFLWRPFFFWRALALVSLASSIPVLGLESVCPRKGCPWPRHRIFLCPWPRALCPRLHLFDAVSFQFGSHKTAQKSQFLIPMSASKT